MLYTIEMKHICFHQKTCLLGDYFYYRKLCRNNNFDDDCSNKVPWACTQDKITIRYMKKNCVKACGWCY